MRDLLGLPFRDAGSRLAALWRGVCCGMITGLGFRVSGVKTLHAAQTKTTQGPLNPKPSP